MTESAFSATAGTTTLSTASTTYFGAWGGDFVSTSANTTEANAGVKNRGAVTIQNCRLNVKTNGNANAATWTQRNNGADGAVTISITASTTGAFADTTHTDSIADGSTFPYKLVTGASTVSLLITGASIERVSAGQAFTMLSSFGNTAVSTGNVFGFFGGTTSNTTAEANRFGFALEALTFSNLQVIELSTASFGINTSFTFRKNGANGNQVLTVTALTTGQFEDTTHSDTLAATDTYDCFESTNATGGAIAAFAVKALGATANRVAMIAGTGGTVQANPTFMSVIGQAGPNATETNLQVPVPVAETWDQAWMNVRTNTAATDTTVISRVAAADGNQTVAITASTTGLFRDTTHSDSPTAGQLVNWKTSGTNAANTTINTTGSRWTGPAAAADTLAPQAIF